MQTNIDLLRHGEVLGGSCYRGITDDPLTAQGWLQMQDKLNNATHWDVIISSPLSRCHQFATHVSSNLQRPLISESAFQEINFGDWEGKTAEQIEPQLLSQFYADPVNFSPPNGEHFNDFQQRILAAWQTLLEAQQGKNLLLITHAGVMRIILAHSLGLDIQHSFRLKIGHACLSSLEHFHSLEIGNFCQLIKHG
ncbi:MAG: alpha-ribazole phosphatase family protein [Methyloprofundus sp.]|nr:alpha-ribazole phosphatase family protein [Methyloprofundus sp.]